MTRLVSCVPGSLRDACSMFFKRICAASDNPSAYLTFVMSPCTACLRPLTSVYLLHNKFAIYFAPFSKASGVQDFETSSPFFAHTHKVNVSD